MGYTTPHLFRFGVVAPQAGSAAEWKGIAARVEALGYSTLLLPDTPGPILAPFAALGVAAGSTSTLRGDNDYASLGLEPVPAGVRLRRLGETLQIIRALFAGERVTFHGKHYTVANATLYPSPQRQLPILIAASGPKAVAQAGQYADIVALGSYSRDLLSQQVGWLQAAAGERFGRIELASLALVVPENDPAAVQAAAAVVRRFGLDLETAIANKAPTSWLGRLQR